MNRQEVTEYIDRTVEKTGKTRSAVCSQKYYMQHLEEQRRKAREYYYRHREEILKRQKEQRRKGKTGHVK